MVKILQYLMISSKFHVMLWKVKYKCPEIPFHLLRKCMCAHVCARHLLVSTSLQLLH